MRLCWSLVFAQSDGVATFLRIATLRNDSSGSNLNYLESLKI
ncbi:hypothetical protein RSSM_00609 [Rhodopirellula sallentina SM41]|uniref:Uncharacterized protein n=1 Tax=Rhodopirellula sallentina SM41 TaxID=1263870 RepID=M5U9J3_9BACT|nr:hypothetical protein RSSM_00609 [Rhodopirellula sallentina SM41]